MLVQSDTHCPTGVTDGEGQDRDGGSNWAGAPIVRWAAL